MKILITGGAGMIGSSLAKSLIKKHEIIIVDNFSRGKIENLKDDQENLIVNADNIYNVDLKIINSLDDLLIGVDVVYHLADIVAGIDYVFNNQLNIFNENLLINTNVVQSILKHKIKNYIYVGTACSFPLELQNGVHSTPLIEEDQYPANPESAYGWSKLMGEYEANLLQKETDTNVGLLSLHNVYGPPCDFTEEKSQVIPSLIRKRILNPNKNLEVWGDGSQGRAFVHVNDVIKSLELILEKGMNQNVIQIGPSTCTTIKEIAELIVTIIPGTGKIIYDKTKPTGDLGRSCNYQKAKSILGWEPTVDLNDGLIDLVSWISSKL